MSDAKPNEESRVVLVTGGSRGIGAAVARAAGAAGETVVVNYRSEQARAAEVVESIRRDGGRAAACRADVADLDQVKGMFRSIREDHGGVDVLVNNAGLMTPAMVTLTSERDFDAQMAVNVKGCFFCMQQAAKQMARKRRGRIVNVSSIVGRFGAAGHAAYAASKAAVIGMSLAAAKELAPMGVTVNVVAPGLIDTDMTADIPAETRAEILSRIPAGRPGTPEEVARVVLLLAAEKNAYLTGQVVGIDGGQVM